MADFERYKAGLLRAEDEREVDWIMERAAQEGELTGEQFDRLALLALKRKHGPVGRREAARDEAACHEDEHV